MKQKFKLVTAFMCGAIFFSGVSYAATELKAKQTNYKIQLNSQDLNGVKSPISVEGSTYLPIRSLAESLGYEVSFNNGVIDLSDKKENNNIDIDSSEAVDGKDGWVKSVSSNELKQFSKELGYETYNFRKLPITVEHDNLIVTIHSMTQKDSFTEFDIEVVNNNSFSSRPNFSNEAVYNHSLKGVKMGSVGTIDLGKLKNNLEPNTTIRETIKKGKIPTDANNIVLRASYSTDFTFEFPIKLK